MSALSLRGNIVDVVQGRIFRGTLQIDEGKIISVSEQDGSGDCFIIPGLIDSHVHIESSMLIPSEFARLAVVHGTVGCVSDPHEIANVLGIDGIRFMLNNAAKVPFKFCFGAPSCVPSTPLATAGAEFSPEDVENILKLEGIGYLSEMMDVPGVINKTPDVMAKITAAQKLGKPIDGHAPGLCGTAAKQYYQAGISTDHECFNKEAALDKIQNGMKILIREGSAAKNFDALVDLLEEHPGSVMLCSDDKHPDDLVRGHINELIKRALSRGIEPMKVLRAATLNPTRHYNLSVGLLQPGDPADFVIIDSLENFAIQQTFIDGVKVAENGSALLETIDEKPQNNFNRTEITESDLALKAESDRIRVIEVQDGQLLTHECIEQAFIQDGIAEGNPDKDILLATVINRYEKTLPALGFVKNFGLSTGALASSVAHDSHNIVAVGTNRSDLTKAINLVISHKGGIAVVGNGEEGVLPLPVAGLMCVRDGYTVAAEYERLDKMAKELGSSLSSPFMTLSFLSLLVIPELKLGNKGLFDGRTSKFISVFVSE